MKTVRSLGLTVALLAILTAVGCDSIGGALGGHADAVARADGYELSVEETVAILEESPQVQRQKPVVEALANVWADYVLLAHQMRVDSALETVDLEPVIAPEVEQAMVFALRDSVIDVDTAISDEELESLYETELPGGQVRARHILLTPPPEATEEQKDSVRALAEEVLRRARAGEDFGELAREFSDDPATASEGGDLGYFGHGDMVKPFEVAAFALEPGEVSDIVPTPYGLHIIKVEDRRVADFEDVADMFRRQVKDRRVLRAESAYVRSIQDPEEVEVSDEGVDIFRGLARNPRSDLTRRAANRTVVSYPGGEFTAGELLNIVRSASSSQRRSLQSAPDEEVAGILKQLASQDALVTEAERRGLRLDPAQRDSILAEAKERIRNFAGQLRLRSVDVGEEETEKEAVERAVKETLAAILSGDRQMVTLGNMAHVLRESYGVQVFAHNVPRVLEQLGDTVPGEGGRRPPVAPAPNAPRPLPGTGGDTTGMPGGTSGAGGS